MRRFRLQTELSAALCFDIAVQIGLKQQAEDELERQPISQMSEIEVRELLAAAVAKTAAPRWQADVRNRKMTIARGQGVVHGDRYLLSIWALDDFPITQSAEII